jgi:hypothetical protein
MKAANDENRAKQEQAANEEDAAWLKAQTKTSGGYTR